MPKFQYKFESIKKIKEALEKKAQKEIALIDLEIKKKEDEYKLLTEEELKSKKDFFKGEISSTELKFKKNYELYLRNQRMVLMNQIKVLNDKRKLKMDELMQRSKEHKIFDTLEENYIEVFKKEQNKIELEQINEIATQKFVRQEK